MRSKMNFVELDEESPRIGSLRRMLITKATELLKPTHATTTAKYTCARELCQQRVEIQWPSFLPESSRPKWGLQTLPCELRNHIYELAILAVTDEDSLWDPARYTVTKSIPALLLTCRQVYHEVRSPANSQRMFRVCPNLPSKFSISTISGNA
jgi:hypothetical protein